MKRTQKVIPQKQKHEFFRTQMDQAEVSNLPIFPGGAKGAWLVLLAVFVGVVSWKILDWVLGVELPAELMGYKDHIITLVFLAGFVVLLLTLISLLRLSRARARVEKNHEIIRGVLEGSQGARLIADRHGKHVYSNDRFKALFHGQETPGFTDLKQFFASNSDAGVFLDKAISKGCQQGPIYMEAVAQDTMTGELRSYGITAQNVEGWRGHVHFRIDDITDQKEVEKAVDSERKRLIDFMDNALVGFFSVDEKGYFVFANSTLARWLGFRKGEELVGKKVHTFLVTPPKNGAAYDVFEQGGAKQFGETLMRGQEGREFNAAIAHAVVYEENGMVRTQSVVRDLTPENEMKDALKISEDRFHRFFEDAPTGIVLLNTQGVIEEANPSFQGLVDKNNKQLRGKNLTDFIDKEDHAKVKSMIRSLDLEAHLSAPVELRFSQPLDMTAQVFAGRLRGSQNLIFHFHDLTRQKQLEAQFTQSQKMQAVGQLAGGVAHDFNNLLTAMIGFCDLLLERHKPGDPSFQDIMQIKQNGNRAANLVRQLLAFSRQQTLRLRSLSTTDVLVDLSHLLRRLIGLNIELNLHHGQGVWSIYADQGQVEQVLTNLVVNARDAMKENGGTITIRTKNFENGTPIDFGSDVMPAGEWVCVEVEDQGCGIPQKNISRIFDPFFTTKAMGEGTGLGLSTVYGIVRQTGGFLTVQSEEGKGTTFVIYLPRYDETKNVVQEEKQENQIQDLTGNETILLVEDEEAVRKFSARALKSKGYEVLEAEHGLAALEIFDKQKTPISLIISDVMMPEMDGPTMAQKIHEKDSDIRILFVSGFTEDRIKDHAGENIFFLPKPFSLKQLAAKVKEVLE